MSGLEYVCRESGAHMQKDSGGRTKQQFFFFKSVTLSVDPTCSNLHAKPRFSSLLMAQPPIPFYNRDCLFLLEHVVSDFKVG